MNNSQSKQNNPVRVFSLRRNAAEFYNGNIFITWNESIFWWACRLPFSRIVAENEENEENEINLGDSSRRDSGE